MYYVKLQVARQRNEASIWARVRLYVCMLIVSELAPPLPYRCRAVWCGFRFVCACVRSRVRCWSRAYPHRHDGAGVGWSGCRMATYGTKLHAYTETEFSLFLSLVLRSLSRSLPCLPLVVLSDGSTPYGKVGCGWVSKSVPFRCTKIRSQIGS